MKKGEIKMKKKLFFAIFSIFLLLNFTTCRKENSKEKVKAKDPYFIKELNLTQQEKIEDYEWFWGFIYEGYPFVEVLQRRGIDLEKIKEEWYKKLKDPSLDTKEEYLTFYGDLCAKITDNKPIGHLWPISYEGYEDVYKTYFPYMGLDKMEIDLIDNFYAARPLGSYAKTIWSETQNISGVQTNIIEKDKIACIRLDSFMIFDEEEENKYYQDIENFLEDTREYKHLIIDITRNGGGYSKFWEYIVRLHSWEDIYFYKYGLYKESDYIKKYIDAIFKTYSIEKINIKDVPKLDIKDCKFNMACKKVDKLRPKCLLGGYPRDDRKIWLLVSDKTHSGADQFAGFCRQTGFATVVGEHTAGDGMSVIGPLPVPLPKSGVLILFDSSYGLNIDGTCNQEFGTAPDIYNQPGEVAMQTCIRAIREMEKAGD